MRSRMSSGTLGRPSGNLSPCQSGVYLMTSSDVKNPSWPERRGASARSAAPTRIPATNLCILDSPMDVAEEVLLFGLEPWCSGDLSFLCDFVVHLHTEAWPIGRSDITVDDDLAFFYKSFPK